MAEQKPPVVSQSSLAQQSAQRAQSQPGAKTENPPEPTDLQRAAEVEKFKSDQNQSAKDLAANQEQEARLKEEDQKRATQQQSSQGGQKTGNKSVDALSESLGSVQEAHNKLREAMGSAGGKDAAQFNQALGVLQQAQQTIQQAMSHIQGKEE